MKKREEGEVVRKSGLVYAAVFSIFASTVTCLAAGWLLDRWLDTSPWLLVTGIVLGAGVGFYQFVKIISRVT